MYKLFIATPLEVVFDGEAKDVKAPGGLGYFEVLSHHAPMISTLKSGKLEFIDQNGKQWEYHVSGGILEVEQTCVSILLDSFN